MPQVRWDLGRWCESPHATRTGRLLPLGCLHCRIGRLILPIADSELIIGNAEAELAAIDAVTVVPPSYRSADGEAASQLIDQLQHLCLVVRYGK